MPVYLCAHKTKHVPGHRGREKPARAPYLFGIELPWLLPGGYKSENGGETIAEQQTSIPRGGENRIVQTCWAGGADLSWTLPSAGRSLGLTAQRQGPPLAAYPMSHTLHPARNSLPRGCCLGGGGHGQGEMGSLGLGKPGVLAPCPPSLTTQLYCPPRRSRLHPFPCRGLAPT